MYKLSLKSYNIKIMHYSQTQWNYISIVQPHKQKMYRVSNYSSLIIRLYCSLKRC